MVCLSRVSKVSSESVGACVGSNSPPIFIVLPQADKNVRVATDKATVFKIVLNIRKSFANIYVIQ